MTNKIKNSNKYNDIEGLSTVVSSGEFDFSNDSLEGKSCCAYYCAAYSLDMLRLLGVDEDEPICHIYPGTKVICDNAFQAFGRSSIETIFIPDSIEKIGKNAINPKVCTSLKSIEVPIGATTKFKSLLNHSLWKFITEVSSPEYHNSLSTESPSSLENDDYVIHVLPNTIAFYSPDFSKFYGLRQEVDGIQFQCNEYQILDGTKIICDRAFYEHDTIETVVLPDSIIRAGIDVFKHCPNLKDICIPKGTMKRFIRLFGSKIETYLVEIDLPHKDISELDGEPVTSVLEQDKLDENEFLQFINSNGIAIYSRDFKKLLSVNNEDVSLIEYNVLFGTHIICDGAFKYCENLESVVIPETVYAIGKNVFVGCKSLKKIIVPKETKDYYSSFFQAEIANLISEENVEENYCNFSYFDAANGVFYSMDFSTVLDYAYNMTFPNVVNILDRTKVLADYSSHNEQISVLSLPDSIISIGKENVFSQNLVTIKVPKGSLPKFRELIADEHFNSLLTDGTFIPNPKSLNRENNQKMVVKAKAKVIPLEPLLQNNDVIKGDGESICIEEKNKSIELSSSAENNKENIAVIKSVKKELIKERESGDNLISIERPKELDFPYVIDSFKDGKKNTYFGAANYNISRTELYDFFDKGLSQYDVLQGTKSICDFAFKSSNLVSVSLPKSLKRIGIGVFDDCAKLKSIGIPTGTKGYFMEILGHNLSHYIIEVPESPVKVSHSKNISGSDLKRTILCVNSYSKNNGYEGIRYSKDGRRMLFMTDSCKTEVLTIIPGVEVVCNPASNISHIIQNINIDIHTIFIPNSVKEISDNAFNSFTNLNKIVIPKGTFKFFAQKIPEKWHLLSEDEKKISNNNVHNYHIIKYGTAVIKKYSFKNINCTNVLIPDTVSGIEDNAFENASIESLVIPNSVGNIGDCAFRHCQKLRSITLPKNIELISKEMLCECESLEELSIPAKVKSIGKNAFVDCKSLKIVKLSKNITSIKKGWMASDPFKGCLSLKKIIVPKGTIDYYKKLFKGMKAIELLTYK